MKHSESRWRDGVYLALALGLIAVSPARAAEPNWPPGPYRYFVIDQDLRTVLQEFGRHLNVPVRISETVGPTRIKGQLSASTARDFLEWICASYQLVWYFDGSILQVYHQSELRSEFFDRGPLPAEELTQRLERSGIADPRFPLRQTGDERLIAVVGPPSYLAKLRRVVASMTEAAARLPAQSAAATPTPSAAALSAPGAEAPAAAEPLRHQAPAAATETAPMPAGSAQAQENQPAEATAPAATTGSAAEIPAAPATQTATEVETGVRQGEASTFQNPGIVVQMRGAEAGNTTASPEARKPSPEDIRHGVLVFRGGRH